MSINTLYEASSIAMCVDEENIWLVDERSINLFVKSKRFEKIVFICRVKILFYPATDLLL